MSAPTAVGQVPSAPLHHLAAAGLVLVLAAACRDDLPTLPVAPPAPARALGLVEISLNAIGTAQMSARARVPAPTSGARFSLSAPANGNGSGSRSVQLQALSTGSFTDGVRGAGGYRYLWATFRVRNAQSDGTPYDTPRQNLTFFAVSTPSTLAGSAISSMRRFDGSTVPSSVATGIVPTGSVDRSLRGTLVSRGADVLQVLTEGETSALPVLGGVDPLPYGFVVRNVATDGRTLPALPAASQYDGIVTFAFKIPLQATAADDPFETSALFQAADDSEIRITQSSEEQTPTGETAFLARAAQIGATMKTVLPGVGSYAGDAATTRTLCAVRTAGTSANPTAYLVNAPAVSVQIIDPAPGTPLWIGGSVARDLGLMARDGGGAAVPDVPVQVTFGTAGVFQRWERGGIRAIARRDRTTSTVTAAACGLNTTSAPLASSGVNPITAGAIRTLALKPDGTVATWGAGPWSPPGGLTGVVQVVARGTAWLTVKSDGTVVAWGDNVFGQLNVPPGLTGVVQLAAGTNFSLALKSDGTVVQWGSTSGSPPPTPPPPPGLTGIVQIAATDFHALALKSDGTVVAWGFAFAGETTVPSGLTGVIQIAAGPFHSLALRRDGTVIGWGASGSGQLNAPPGLAGVVQIAAGLDYSLALESDGTVVGWGTNGSGQVTVPPGLTGVVQVAAGRASALALKSDGTIVGWGSNTNGELNVPPGFVAAVP